MVVFFVLSIIALNIGALICYGVCFANIYSMHWGIWVIGTALNLISVVIFIIAVKLNNKQEHREKLELEWVNEKGERCTVQS